MANTTATRATRYNFSDAKWMGICEYYSNHTAPATMDHFDIDIHQNTLSYHYKRLGFLPKSAARNPVESNTVSQSINGIFSFCITSFTNFLTSS